MPTLDAGLPLANWGFLSSLGAGSGSVGVRQQRRFPKLPQLLTSLGWMSAEMRVPVHRDRFDSFVSDLMETVPGYDNAVLIKGLPTPRCVRQLAAS